VSTVHTVTLFARVVWGPKPSCVNVMCISEAEAYGSSLKLYMALSDELV
jgi:hypothetical protein